VNVGGMYYSCACCTARWPAHNAGVTMRLLMMFYTVPRACTRRNAPEGSLSGAEAGGFLVTAPALLPASC
jgi:hypothetical protein